MSFSAWTLCRRAMDAVSIGRSLLRAAIGQPPLDRLTADSYNRWFSAATAGRVIPALIEVAGKTEPDLTGPQWEELIAVDRAVQARSLHLENQLSAIAQVLDARDIEYAALKGSATAHLDYPSPAARQLGDIDILVRPESLQMAETHLSAAGWFRAYGLPGGHEKFTHAITLRDRTNVELDVHQAIAHRAVGLRVPTSELLSRAERYALPRSTQLALCANDRFLHAAVHLGTADPAHRRLSSMADVLLLAHSPEVDPFATFSSAAEWRLSWLVVRALKIAFRSAEMDVPDRWMSAIEVIPPRDDLLIRLAYRAASRRAVIEELAYLRLLSKRDAFRYLRGYMRPDDLYRSSHGRGPVAQSRYLARKALGK